MTKSELEDYDEMQDIVRVNYDFPLASLPRGKWISNVRYPNGTIRELFYGGRKRAIDPLIQDLILKLNITKHWTMAACQGKTQLKQFGMTHDDEGGHDPEAYIGFDNPIPKRILNRLHKEGIRSYGDDRGITSRNFKLPTHYEKYEGDDRPTLIIDWTEELKINMIEVNLAFVDKVSRAFRL